MRPIVRFAREYRAALERVPTLFFSVGLALLSKVSDGRAQTMEIVDKFISQTGWRPRRIELVAGALPYTKYNFLIRILMRRIARRRVARPTPHATTSTRTGRLWTGSRSSSWSRSRGRRHPHRRLGPEPSTTRGATRSLPGNLGCNGCRLPLRLHP
jgi:hypothetical protein